MSEIISLVKCPQCGHNEFSIPVNADDIVNLLERSDEIGFSIQFIQSDFDGYGGKSIFCNNCRAEYNRELLLQNGKFLRYGKGVIKNA